MVLIDLGNFSGFYGVTGVEDRDSLQYREGMRAVFARIFNFVNLTAEEAQFIAQRVRIERQVDELAHMESTDAPASE